ncbi:AEC family transporter [Shinella zoogloeoides]|uniref:AEC family transporter n=1 Tax=Shinella zoogloeoides TaxID=352475 RepID=A0A6N8T8L3_SHIZO|nr:AEC family transporter [Shinella zoogloeoides]MXN99308.1 AEC family transporter [Shinella zoogloeoides]UEX82909.1 AEC family transporter [Shinella zoogloeoides]
MLAIFETILPVFLLVVLGALLKRWRQIDRDMWNGLEQLGFFVLFPALLFITLAKAEFSGIDAGAIALGSIGSVTLIALLLILSWPLFRAAQVSGASYTTVFQTSTRWNAFIALAIGEKLYGAESLALVALVATLIIIPLNFYNIAILVWFGGGTRSLKTFAQKILTNPMIIGSVLGVLVNLSGVHIYAPLMQTVEFVADTSLSLGLIMVGAGLKLADALKPRPLALLPVGLKLVFMPLVMTGAAYALGLRGEQLLTIAMGASVPTAMNGYVLAKQMGGDAPLYAAVATLQTIASFFTIPMVLTATAYLAGG